MPYRCGHGFRTRQEIARGGLIKKRAEGRKVHLHPTRRAATLLDTIDLLWESPAD
jgi:hypothetical protein